MAENIYSTQEFVVSYMARYYRTPILTDRLHEILKSERSTVFLAGLYSAKINKSMLMNVSGPSHSQLVKVAEQILSNGDFVNLVKIQRFYKDCIADIITSEWDALSDTAFDVMDSLIKAEKYVDLNLRKPHKSFSLPSIIRPKPEKVSDAITREEFGLEQSLIMTNAVRLSNRLSTVGCEVLDLKDDIEALKIEVMDLKKERNDLEIEIKNLNLISNNIKISIQKIETKLEARMSAMEAKMNKLPRGGIKPQ